MVLPLPSMKIAEVTLRAEKPKLARAVSGWKLPCGRTTVSAPRPAGQPPAGASLFAVVMASTRLQLAPTLIVAASAGV